MTTQSTTQASAEQTGSNYINFHCTGIGYMRRVRTVAVKKGNSFVAASINAMFGEKGVKDGIQYTKFDVTAVSDQARDVLEQFAAHANNDYTRVMVKFKIGDFAPKTFTYEKGVNVGQIGVEMKGRLLKVTHVWCQKLKDGNGDEKVAVGEMELMYDLAQELAIAQAAAEQEKADADAQANAQAEYEAARTGTEG